MLTSESQLPSFPSVPFPSPLIASETPPPWWYCLRTGPIMLFSMGLDVEVHSPQAIRWKDISAWPPSAGQPCRSTVTSQATPGSWCQGRGMLDHPNSHKAEILPWGSSHASPCTHLPPLPSIPSPEFSLLFQLTNLSFQMQEAEVRGCGRNGDERGGDET